jgi:signal transduction histidine kinase
MFGAVVKGLRRLRGPSVFTEVDPSDSGARPASAEAPLDLRRFEGRLFLDDAGRIAEATWNPEYPDDDLEGAFGPLAKGSLLGAVDLSLADALAVAARYGASGRRIGFIPGKAGSRVPTWIEATERPRAGGFSIRIARVDAPPPLLEQLPRLSRRDLALAGAGMAIDEPSTLRDVADRLMPTVLDLCDAKAGVVLTGHSATDDLEVLAEYGQPPFDRQMRLPAEAFISATGGCVAGQLVGVQREGELPTALRPGGRGKSHYVSVFVAGAGASSALWLVCDQPVSPSQILAAQLVTAQLTQQLAICGYRDEASRRRHELELVYSATEAVTTEHDTSSPLSWLSRWISHDRKYLDASFLVLELDPETHDFAVVPADAHSLTPGPEHLQFPELEAVEASLAEGAPIPVRRIVSVGGGASSKALGAQSALLVPIVGRRSPVGATLIYSKDPARTFSAAELAVVEHVSALVASAADNAQLYRNLSDHQMHIRALLHKASTVREQERSEIATVVHNEITQFLVGAVYSLESLVNRLDEPQRREVLDTIGDLREALRRSRDVIASLRYAVLTQLGLPAALRKLARIFEQESGISCTVKCFNAQPMSEELEICLYRIAREATENSRRHSQASALRMELVYARDTVSLRISDNGRGLASASQKQGHFGILMMQELAAGYGGTCSITTGRKGGVVVAARIPVLVDAAGYRALSMTRGPHDE